MPIVWKLTTSPKVITVKPSCLFKLTDMYTAWHMYVLLVFSAGICQRKNIFAQLTDILPMLADTAGQSYNCIQAVLGNSRKRVLVSTRCIFSWVIYASLVSVSSLAEKLSSSCFWGEELSFSHLVAFMSIQNNTGGKIKDKILFRVAFNRKMSQPNSIGTNREAFSRSCSSYNQLEHFFQQENCYR